METRLNAGLLIREVTFQTSRSSGPGGQNVNKVNTKVALKFPVNDSTILTEEEKRIIHEKLSAKINSEGVLMIVSQDKRTQQQNKEEALRKLDVMLRKAFRKKKARKPTKPTKASRDKRIRSKKQVSEKKQWRQKPL